jgi:hypothetical protein
MQHHEQQHHGCDPTNTISGSATYVSSSSTESEDARSSTGEDSHTDRTTEEEDQLLVVVSSSMAIVPFQQDVVDAVLEDEDINAESLYQELIVRDDGEPQETDIDALTKMIDDCAARWQNSARVPSRRSLVSITMDAPVTVPPQVRKEEIIAQQRAEIKYLRARLASQDEDGTADVPSSEFAPTGQHPHHDHHHDYYPDLDVQVQQQQHYHHGAGMMMFPPPLPSPVEQIDSVPIEHIEVAVDHDGDLCSVTSGLTNLVDLSSRMPDDATAISYLLEKSFSRRRPDAESSVCSVSLQQQQASPQQAQQRRVTDQPLLLRAADGSSRQALYTGPVQQQHNGIGNTESFTGTGVLKFVETGDLYMGQVSDGEMHGQGTYTFAKQKKKRPHKVLRGQFQNNVYVGWNPDAAFWNDAVAPR